MLNVMIYIFSIVVLAAPAKESRPENQPENPSAQTSKEVRFNDCQNCHTKKNNMFISSKAVTHLQHTIIQGQHGNKDLACNFCHDKNNHNNLRSSTMFPADFKKSSPVCQQCHAEEYRDWTQGIHGKQTGGWKNESRRIYQCIECHNPHSVKFKQMKAKPHPRRPKMGIQKNGTH